MKHATHLQRSSILCNLTTLFVVIQGIEKNECQVLVHTQGILVLVLGQCVDYAVQTPGLGNDLTHKVPRPLQINTIVVNKIAT